MTEETNNDNTNVEVTTEIENEAAAEKIEVEWEKASPIVRELIQKNEAVSQLGQLLVEAESKKDAIKDRIIRLNESLQNTVARIREELNVPQDPSWELDLPEKEGESAFFIKKN